MRGVVGGGYIRVVYDLGLDVGDGGEGDKGSAVMGGGRGACVGSGGVSEGDCCRLPGIIREIWKDLPYSFPFFLKFFFSKVVPLVGLERKK